MSACPIPEHHRIDIWFPETHLAVLVVLGNLLRGHGHGEMQRRSGAEGKRARELDCLQNGTRHQQLQEPITNCPISLHIICRFALREPRRSIRAQRLAAVLVWNMVTVCMPHPLGVLLYATGSSATCTPDGLLLCGRMNEAAMTTQTRREDDMH